MNNSAVQSARPTYLFYEGYRSDLIKKAISKETAHFYFVDDTRIPKKDLESGYYRKASSAWHSSTYRLPTAELEEKFTQQQLVSCVRSIAHTISKLNSSEILSIAKANPELIDKLKQVFKQE